MNDRVYRTKREKYAAVIDEVESLVKQGRPVLVGTTSVEISELLSRMLQMRRIQHQVLNAKLHQKEAEIVALAGQPGKVTIATNMAGRGTDIKLTPEVKAAGGLAIIGTERHESRRVDRQLRGRSGRQGDPGSSVFYVSFEDQLMRVYASDHIMKVLDRLGFKEGEMLEHKMISNSIEKAQKRVEENNFGIRKHLLEYDDVMNKQRTYIYSRRQHALKGERIGIDISNMIYDVIENLVDTYSTPSDFADFQLELMKLLTIEPTFTEAEFGELDREEKVHQLHTAAMDVLARRSERIREIVQPVITEALEAGEQGVRAIPITDGKRIFRILFDLEEAGRTECKSITKEWQKKLVLLTIDELWKEHLRELDDLRQSVRNASYEQKDPLVIYKVESFHMFERMLSSLNNKTVSSLMRGQVFMRQAPAPEQQQQAPVRQQPEVTRAMPAQRAPQDYKLSKATLPSEDAAAAQRAAASARQGEQQKTMPVRAEQHIGRNDPCPCGSGKKYKNCHGRDKN
jgi:preprotein translocase subunit SecA